MSRQFIVIDKHGATTMSNQLKVKTALIAASLLIGSTAALAGEITGPPPPLDSLPGAPGSRVSNGVSICSFSGLNDTPGSFGMPGQMGFDPGGIAQSYGFFMAQFGIYDPSDPDKFTSGSFPGENCNPNRGPRLPH